MRAVTKIAFALILTLTVTACGEQKGVQEQTKAKEISKEPVTITATFDQTNLDDEFFVQLKDHLSKKHPNITFELIKPGKGTMLNELIAAGQTPDIIFTYNGNLASYQTNGLQYDLQPLLKEFQVDLGRIEPFILEDVKIASTKDELFGFPLTLSFHALYYNKDIFDKFGVPYPKDGMNWDQVYQLAKQLTRMENGVQYRGFDPGSFIWSTQPLGIAAIDYKTDKATVNTEQWKKTFELMKAFHTIPGNEPKGSGTDAFLKTKTLAMVGQLNIFNQLEAAAKDGMNWDLVQYPSYPEKPNTYGNASVVVAAISSTSKYKEQAMQVINVMASDEFQLESAKQGRISPLKDPNFKKAFGQNREALKGKNVEGIFKSRPVKYPIASKYRVKAEAIVTKKYNEFVQGKADVNTILAQTEEEINKMVGDEKSK